MTQAGQQAAKDEDAREAASALEKALQDRAAASREPAAAYALVAMVGTGLGENDFRGLDAFLQHLDTRLDQFFKDVEQVRSALPQGDSLPAEWKAFVEAAERARHLTRLANARSLLSEPKARKVRDQQRYEAALKQALGRALETARAVGTPEASTPDGLTTTRTKITGFKEPTDTAKLIKDLLKRMEGLSAEIDVLRETLDQLPVSLESIGALFTPTGGQTGASQRAALGTDFLQRILASDPKLVGRLDEALASKKIKEEDLRQLGALVEDIGRERDAATQRVADYLKTLRQAQLDLHEENLRHDQAIVAIAAQEIKRWSLIRQIDRDASAIYAPGDRACDAQKPPPKPDILLFATESHVKCWAAWYPFHHKAVTRTVPTGVAHPVVEDSDRVLPTVRRLAEIARVWQKASPNNSDPFGFDTETSNQRLWKAAQVVNAHLLMLSVNERLAADNRIRLSNEIAEHELHLGGISARATEAGLNLVLGDVVAFHASGITQADLQAFFGIIQSALLSYIGAGI